MPEYTISDLAARSGVTHRTIRYYVEIGLLPPPEGAGRAAGYTDQHLERLDLIRRLQAARLSLDEIREELARTRPGTDSALLSAREPAAPYDSAADYLARLRRPPPAAVPDLQSEASVTARPLASRLPLPPSAESTPPAGRGESFVAEPWTRIPLSPDVELHVRRRGNRTDHRIARLIKEARRILSEKPAPL
jgi:DNA-binding transcriptional MerR regulator